MKLREPICRTAYRQTPSHQRQRSRSLKRLRLAVRNVKYTRHFISVLSRKATGRKLYRVHHIRIDYAQPFLLSRRYQLRTIHLHSVDIHQILIVCTTSHIILARHLIGRSHTRLRGHQTLNRIARHIRRQARRLRANRLNLIELALIICHLNSLQHISLRQHLHIHSHRTLRLNQMTNRIIISDTSKNHLNSICYSHIQFILAIKPRSGSGHSTSDAN